MDYVGNRNLFFSHFVIGGKLPKNNEIECFNSLNKWLQYKDTGIMSRKYSTEKTQYVCFLHTIEIDTLKHIIYDLMLLYKTKYPYSEKKDFLKDVFGYTLYELENFVNRKYIPFGEPTQETKYTYYFYFDTKELMFYDYAIKQGNDIEYYIQYYKKVIDLIKNIEYKEVCETIYDCIFKVNSINAYSLQKKYNLSEHDTNELYRIFLPFITLTVFDVQSFKNLLQEYKNSFIESYGTFDFEIFEREQLNIFISQLNDFLDCLQKGKAVTYDKQENTFFHSFKLSIDVITNTLLVTNLNLIETEIYFKELLKCVNIFIKTNNENTETPPTIAENKQTIMEQEHDTYEIDFETIADKILSLYELGVIDKLQEHRSFLASPNRLAGYLASIIGKKQISVQPILNALLNNHTTNKNYPKTDKRLKKIHDKLINFGINKEKLKSTTPIDTTD